MFEAQAQSAYTMETDRTDEPMAGTFIRASVHHPSVVPISPSVMQLCLLED